MSGVMPPTEPGPIETAPPQALAELARSLEGTGPSPHVTRALDLEWEALHGAPAGSRRPEGRPKARSWPAWARRGLGAGLGAAAVLVIAALWVGWPTAGRVAPERSEQVGLDAAVPAGPLEPPPARPPGGGGVPVRIGDGAAATPGVSSPGVASARAESPARRDTARSGSSRPAQAVASDEPEPFIWIRGADDIEPGLGVHVVRVQVPRLRWDEGTPSRELVDADVLMGNDGQARALRVVRTSSQ